MQKTIGMAYYEALMYWRRRGMRVILLAMLLILFASVLILAGSRQQIEGMLNLTEQTAQRDELVNNSAITFLTGPALFALLIFILPVVCSDSIPLDQQQRTGELLDALPLSQVEYLAGKVGGLWLVMAAGMLIIAIIHGLLWRVAISSFDIVRYSEIWIGALIIMLLNGGLGVLLAALQPTRVRAALMVMGLLILSIFVVAALARGESSGTIFGYLDPARFALLQHFLQHPYEPNALARVTSLPVLGTFFVGILELAAVFGGIWFLRSRREDLA